MLREIPRAASMAIETGPRQRFLWSWRAQDGRSATPRRRRSTLT